MNVNRLVFALVPLIASLAWTQQYQYPFQDPSLPIEARVDNILLLMSAEEKISALSTTPDVPRLGIRGSGHIEGLHGVAYGGPGGWEGRGLKPLPTTQFPQSVGLGETWDPDLLEKAAAIEGYEARYIFQSEDLRTTNSRGEGHRRKPSGQYKYLAIHMHEPARQRARDLANTPAFASAQRERKKVEAMFAEPKNVIGLRRLRLRRMKFVREQFFLAEAAQNLKRLVRFLSQPTTPIVEPTT